MLHEFLTANRDDLIARCGAKVAQRRESPEMPPASAHGVPLFLQQLTDTLRREQSEPARRKGSSSLAPVSPEMSRAASLHGTELLRLGYSVDQVVRDYGDVCQAVTELAVEQSAGFTATEFSTLNRCLDDAIADAVTAFGAARQSATNADLEALHGRLDAFEGKQRHLIDIAIHSYNAIKTGSVGMAGATSSLLIHTLEQMRALVNQSLPEIRLDYAKAAVK
jgi:hypothetical protein